jgi:hypothetical protein
VRFFKFAVWAFAVASLLYVHELVTSEIALADNLFASRYLRGVDDGR